ncbi:DUF5060 domain-containing protein [Botryobacter ruber]|uniref:DUF5060 domain-containing protein n=1 Tax=Botryobacter ruber TaxID=2171629 RepID=UPI00196B860E|nr:DUF5060 domain-containing protein [Botryobacter ruber]
MKNTSYLFLMLFFLLASPLLAQEKSAPEKVEKWAVFELTLKGTEAGNPFIEVPLTAVFTHNGKTFTPDGFYDGNGMYKVRFMPDAEGTWTYETKSRHEALNGRKGTFSCTAASPGNHGPVQVRDQYHFEYADGTNFFPFGTTIYEWPYNLKETQDQTIETLKKSPFNKARFLAIPPYKEKYTKGPLKITLFPFEGTSKENWDFSRFNPEYFQHLERCVERLLEIGVEADFILLRPYDGAWGFDKMDMATNERFIRYVIARFGAYRNIWWSLANENSFMRHLSQEDWDRLFQVVQQHDPYGHLRSIHNADRLYDYSKPWVTHVSLQYYNAVKAFGVSPLLRDIYRKPIVHDEINYEGNISRRWGQLSGEEMSHRFWMAYIGGAYATHGEATEEGWISNGGTLTGTSPERIAFLKQIVLDGPKEGLNPLDQYYLTNAAGKYGEYYLYYFGTETPKTWAFELPDDGLKNGMRFKVDLIDTWNMKITPLGQVFEVEEVNRYKYSDKKKSKIKLPNKPYMALRIQRIDGAEKQTEKSVKRNELTDEVEQ